MDDVIIISNLNDFIFCPASIYFHKLYGSEDKLSSSCEILRFGYAKNDEKDFIVIT